MALHHEVSASVYAGCVATVLGHPLDCVKVRMQAHGGATGLGTAECALSMLRAEGALAFTHGIGPPLANAVVMNTFMFLAFAEAKRALPQSSFGSLLAGAIAGVLTSVCSTPTDWVKIQAQLRGGSNIHAILTEALRAGPASLFTGQTANMCREGTFTAVYLGLYDVIKRQITGSSGDGSERLPLHLVAAASASTGALAWIVSYPFDVVKVRGRASSAKSRPRHCDCRPAVSVCSWLPLRLCASSRSQCSRRSPRRRQAEKLHWRAPSSGSERQLAGGASTAALLRARSEPSSSRARASSLTSTSNGSSTGSRRGAGSAGRGAGARSPLCILSCTDSGKGALPVSRGVCSAFVHTTQTVTTPVPLLFLCSERTSRRHRDTALVSQRTSCAVRAGRAARGAPVIIYWRS